MKSKVDPFLKWSFRSCLSYALSNPPPTNWSFEAHSRIFSKITPSIVLVKSGVMIRQWNGASHRLKGFKCSGRQSRSTAWIRSSTMPAVVLPDRLPPRNALTGSRLDRNVICLSWGSKPSSGLARSWRSYSARSSRASSCWLGGRLSRALWSILSIRPLFSGTPYRAGRYRRLVRAVRCAGALCLRRRP